MKVHERLASIQKPFNFDYLLFSAALIMLPPWEKSTFFNYLGRLFKPS